jgi:hypothetical protein
MSAPLSPVSENKVDDVPATPAVLGTSSELNECFDLAYCLSDSEKLSLLGMLQRSMSSSSASVMSVPFADLRQDFLSKVVSGCDGSGSSSSSSVPVISKQHANKIRRELERGTTEAGNPLTEEQMQERRSKLERYTNSISGKVDNVQSSIDAANTTLHAVHGNVTNMKHQMDNLPGIMKEAMREAVYDVLSTRYQPPDVTSSPQEQLALQRAQVRHLNSSNNRLQDIVTYENMTDRLATLDKSRGKAMATRIENQLHIKINRDVQRRETAENQSMAKADKESQAFAAKTAKAQAAEAAKVAKTQAAEAAKVAKTQAAEAAKVARTQSSKPVNADVDMSGASTTDAEAEDRVDMLVCICQRFFKSERGLTQHRKVCKVVAENGNADEDAVVVPKQVHTCVCKRALATLKGLQLHQRTCRIYLASSADAVLVSTGLKRKDSDSSSSSSKRPRSNGSRPFATEHVEEEVPSVDRVSEALHPAEHVEEEEVLPVDRVTEALHPAEHVEEEVPAVDRVTEALHPVEHVGEEVPPVDRVTEALHPSDRVEESPLVDANQPCPTFRCAGCGFTANSKVSLAEHQVRSTSCMTAFASSVATISPN